MLLCIPEALMGSGGSTSPDFGVPCVLPSEALPVQLCARVLGVRVRGASARSNLLLVHPRCDLFIRGYSASSYRGGDFLSAEQDDQLCSRGGARVSDPHLSREGQNFTALTDILCGCAQMWHEEHLGECFEAVLDQIAIGGHPGGAEQIAADQPFVTMLRGIFPATVTLAGLQVSPPQRSLMCLP